MSTPDALKPFEWWLELNHYRATSIKKTLADLRRAPSDDPNVTQALRRYVTYARERGLHDGYVELAEQADIAPIERLPHAKPQRRKLEAVAFSEDDWQKLGDAVVGSPDPRDQVLWAMFASGLRVGDVLRVERAVLRKALNTRVLEAERKGGTFIQVPLGVIDPWQALYKGMKVETLAQGAVSNIAAYVADGDPNPDAGGAAYQRTSRRLKHWHRALHLQGRANLHRLRRTMAVNALEATQNPIAVQQMLGNKSLAATSRYIDEVNVRQVGGLQQELYAKGRRR